MKKFLFCYTYLLPYRYLLLLSISLTFFFVSFNFRDTPPPGWYLQTLPTNNPVKDICFIDSLNGYMAMGRTTVTDSTYILKTTNGGENWFVNYSTMNINLNAIQFTDLLTGYAVGYTGYGKIIKTTDEGITWNQIFYAGQELTDLHFANSQTGWVCDVDIAFGAGLLKTTNGGINWVQQLDKTFQPKKLFFLNANTGWMINEPMQLYRTTNSGSNWVYLTYFGDSSGVIPSFYFTSIDTGWITGYGTNSLRKTTDGGYFWNVIQNVPYINYGFGYIHMISNTYGYTTNSLSQIKLVKTINGTDWFMQYVPANSCYKIFLTDSLHGWSNTSTMGKMIATKDGGGPLISSIANESRQVEDFALKQNYPNPFNPSTIIEYRLNTKHNVIISIYDITGRRINVPVNEYKQPGSYSAIFDARLQNGKGNNLAGGIYFYRMEVTDKNQLLYTDTKKMLYIK